MISRKPFLWVIYYVVLLWALNEQQTTITSSISWHSSSDMGPALIIRRFSLLAVLVRQSSGDTSVTVSRKETMGSDFCKEKICIYGLHWQMFHHRNAIRWRVNWNEIILGQHIGDLSRCGAWGDVKILYTTHTPTYMYNQTACLRSII